MPTGSGSLSGALVAVALPLGVTILIETGAAAISGLRRRALGVVVSLNLVTNPILNLLLLLLLWLGAGSAVSRGAIVEYDARQALTTPWFLAALILLEVLVIIVEWRGLVWALGRRSGSSRRLLAVSGTMNTASAVLGTFLLACFA
ncbi:MAG: hypothetical protein JW990_06155 [Thermoleophilia bacterium]|nr:hypothetical protein [Thermoleophilia bacterium]